MEKEQSLDKKSFAEYKRLDEMIKKITESLAGLNKQKKEAELKSINALIDADIDQIKFDGKTFSTKPFLTVKAIDQDELFSFLEKSGNSDLIKRSVNYMSLRAHCKELIDEGKKIPSCVEINYFDKFYMRSSGAN